MAQPHALKRHISGLGLLFISLGAMIGSGWLFAGMYASQQAGPAAIISWIIGAVIMGTIALVFSELAAALPVAGGLARYPHLAFGRTVSFTSSWICWLAYVVVAPMETMAILEYMGNLVPWLTIVQDGDRSLSLAGTGVAAAILVMFTFINLMGVKWLAESNTYLTWWKMAVPLGTAIVLMAYSFEPANFTSHAFAPHGISGIFAAVSMGGIAMSLIGFRAVVELVGEAKNPQKNVPRAIIGSIVIATTLYIILQVAFVGATPQESLEGGWSGIVSHGPSGPFAAFAMALGLSWLGVILYVDSVASPFGTALIYTAGTSRLMLAMSRNRNIPAWIGRISARGVPLQSLGINLVVGWIMLAPLPEWSVLVGIVASSTMLAGGIGALVLTVFRRQYPELKRPFKLPFGSAVGVLAFVFSSLVMYWGGWSVNSTVAIVIGVGLLLFVVSIPLMKLSLSELHLKHSIWMFVYIAGMFILSALGSYSGGHDVIPSPVGDLVVIAWSIIMALVGVKSALPRAISEPLINEAMEELHDLDCGLEGSAPVPSVEGS